MVILIKEICVLARSPLFVTYEGFTAPVKEVEDLKVLGFNERPLSVVTCANHAFLLAVESLSIGVWHRVHPAFFTDLKQNTPC